MPETTKSTPGPRQAVPGAPHHTSTTAGLIITAPRTAHLPALDGLRGLAVLMVFLHHAYRLPALWSGVDLFFILSGYLITNILLRDAGRMRFGPLLRTFYVRRAQRILPAYVLAITLIALLTHQEWKQLWPFYAFFVQNVPYAFRMIGYGPLVPLWSLAVEQHFYLVWPFVVFFVPRRWLRPVLLVILIGEPLLRVVMTPIFRYPEAIYALSPFRIDTMAAGALAALVLPQCNPAKATRYAWTASALSLLLFAGLSVESWFRRGANSRAFNGLGYSATLVILGGVFIAVTLASPQSLLSRSLAWGPLRALGRVSYSFYLLHVLFLTLWAGRFGRLWGVPAVFCVTTVVAACSWFLLEKPILAMGGAHRGAAAKVHPA